MAGILISGAIILYSTYVILRKIKQFKRGQFCDCGCKSCTANCSQKNH